MNTAMWKELLTLWSEDVLDSPLSEELDYVITPEMRAARWLGYERASEEEIVATEKRLKTRFPPSYRSFLSVTNGWSVVTPLSGQLWPTHEVGWLRQKDPSLISSWGEDDDDVPDEQYFIYGERQDVCAIRGRYFHTALALNGPNYGGCDSYLLNPKIVTPEGEWEAWDFGAWKPGASRYRSFWEMMQYEYESMLRLKDTD